MTESNSPVGFAAGPGQPPASIERVRYFMHYEPRAGLIRHLHTVVTFKGADASSDEHHWTQAGKIAARHNPRADRLEKIVLEGGEKPTPRHRIDHKSGKLVLMQDAPAERPRRGAKSPAKTKARKPAGKNKGRKTR